MSLDFEPLNCTLGEAYSHFLKAKGWLQPYNNWSITSGSLPPGITLNASTGELSGTASSPGVFTFAVTVTDICNNSGTKNFSILVIKDTVPEQWRAIHNLGGNGSFIPGMGIAFDGGGNVYVSGPSFIGSDTYGHIATIKYNSSGNVLWEKQYIGGDIDFAADVAVDQNGNVYVVGNSLSKQSNRDHWTIIKYDPLGNIIWTKLSDSGSDLAFGVAIDKDGNVYVVAYNNGDYLLIKYDPAGNIIWTKQYGNAQDIEFPYGGVAIDGDGNVFVSGYFYSYSNGTYSHFIVKHDPSGNVVWTNKSDPGFWYYDGHGIAADKNGSIYALRKSVNDPELIYILKFDPFGSLLWSVPYYGFGMNDNGIAADESGNSYVMGQIFDERTQSYNPVYLTIKYDPFGNVVWTKISDGGNRPGGIAVDGKGSIAVTGLGSNDWLTIMYNDPGFNEICDPITSTCNDNNACTTDRCDPVTKRCIHTLVVCNDNNACTADTCNPATGCVHTPVVCNDNNACTTDTCDPAIGCVYTPTIVCNDNNACTTDSCDPATGNCVFTLNCDDRNDCTIDTCDPAKGCVHTPIDNCIVDTTGNNFTMVNPSGAKMGGTNDIRFTWDGTRKASVAVSDQIPNATLSFSCLFEGFTWAIHDLAIYGPGTYTIYDGCDAKSPGCGTGNPVTFTVGPNQIGGHMLFNWGAAYPTVCGQTNCNIDLVNVWEPKSVFGPSIMFDGSQAGGCGTNPASKVWDWMSYDWNGDGINGAPMTEIAFAGFNANFNLMGIAVDPCEGKVCSDNNACTTDYCDPLTRTCVFKPAVCNDNNACTTDICDPEIGCIYTPNIVCNDNNSCTIDSCDPATGSCAFAPITCDDYDACTTDRCDPATGNCIHTATAVCVNTDNNNFTMINSGANTSITGGSNDVRFTWDGSLKTVVAASGQASNATLSSSCRFFGFTWSAHDVAIYGPGTYTVYTACPAGSPGCGAGAPISFTVGAGELGIHALFDWNVTKDMDIVNVWKPKAVFSPSPLWTGACGSNSAVRVWDWMSKDWDGDGKNGSPFVDGPFIGFSWNFNVMGIPPGCTPPAAGFCDDNNVCTDDGYDSTAPGPGVCPCTHTYNTAPCNDNNVCTANDVCSNGVCVGTLIAGCCLIDTDCNDNDICTADTCDLTTHRCKFTPIVPPQCNDNNVCTTDECTANQCTHISNTLPCDDVFFCNGADTCSNGNCSVHSGNPCKSGTTCKEATKSCEPRVVTGSDVGIVSFQVTQKTKACNSILPITVAAKNFGKTTVTGTITVYKNNVAVKTWTGVKFYPGKYVTRIFDYKLANDGGKVLSWHATVDVPNDPNLSNNTSPVKTTTVAKCKNRGRGDKDRDRDDN